MSESDRPNSTIDIELTNDTVNGSNFVIDLTSIKQFLAAYSCSDNFCMGILIVYIVLIVLSLIGNIFIIVSEINSRRKRNTMSTLFLHMAIADLIQTVFIMLVDTIWRFTESWYGGQAFCKIYKFLNMFGLYLATYIVAAVVMDRCVSIWQPLQNARAPRRVKILLTVAWCTSAVLSTPQAVIFDVVYADLRIINRTLTVCGDFHFYSQSSTSPFPLGRKLYSLLVLLVSYVGPTLIMIVLFVLIVYRLTSQRKQKEFCGMNSNDPMMMRRDKLLAKATNRLLTMAVVIVTVFLINWTPYHVGMAMMVSGVELSSVVQHILLMFGSTNCIFNPGIYVIFKYPSFLHGKRSRGSHVDRSCFTSNDEHKNGVRVKKLVSAKSQSTV